MSDPVAEAMARVGDAVDLAAQYVRDDHEYTLVSHMRDNEYAEAFVTLADLRLLLSALREAREAEAKLAAAKLASAKQDAFVDGAKWADREIPADTMNTPMALREAYRRFPSGEP